jgi:NCAIR mutase (PurE)-related protein
MNPSLLNAVCEEAVQRKPPMKREEIEKLLHDYEDRRIQREELVEILSSEGFSDLGHAKVDTSRIERLGFPEVVFCPNKSDKEILDIARVLYQKNGFALLTRAGKTQFAFLKKHLSGAVFHEKASLIVIGKGMKKRGAVSVLSAGTSDVPVAEEAAVTAEVFGCVVQRIYDVGVAGLHRLLAYRHDIGSSNVIVAVAGMEGALPSVLGGLFGIPIIGVPTSVGYGAGFSGIAPLLTMLNTCAPGVSVVNINNGFGAGYLASLINKMVEDARKKGE